MLVGFALSVLLINVAGSQATFTSIKNAQPGFVLLILLAQALRYVGSSGSTFVLAEIFGQRLPFWPLYETMMAGQALNRTFSAGGAAGVWARYSFMTRQGMHSGRFVALLAVEDLIGAVAIFLIFVTGLAGAVAAAALPELGWLILLAFSSGIIVLGAGSLYLYRRRLLVERAAHRAARAFSAVLGRIIGKEVYQRDHVDLAIAEFYAAMSRARTDPPRLAGSFLFNLWRLAFDAASLYLAFWAIGFPISPGIALVLFTTSSVLSTLSAAPGEFGVMETSLAILSTALGIPPPSAVGAIVLFRALSYWLPIPVGYAMFGHLEKRGLI
jgi:uncharacterized protein (TIRG00374 family)